MLLQGGARETVTDDSGCVPLHYAAQDFPELVPLLAARGAGINTPDEEGRSPLCWAVMQGNALSCRKVLEHGADPQLGDKEVRLANGCLSAQRGVWESGVESLRERFSV